MNNDNKDEKKLKLIMMMIMLMVKIIKIIIIMMMIILFIFKNMYIIYIDCSIFTGVNLPNQSVSGYVLVSLLCLFVHRGNDHPF